MLLYRRALLTGVVVLFYGNVALWAFASGTSPLPPLAFIAVLLIATLPLLLIRGKLDALLATPLLWWIAAYVVVIVWWFLWTSPTTATFQILRTRLVGVVFLVTVMVHLLDSQISLDARRLVCLFVALAVALNVYEFFHLGTFSNVIGRAAGLYINPNISGSSILAGLIVGLISVPPRWRPMWTIAALIGITLTISRGALLCAGAVLIFLCAMKVVSTRLLIYSVFALVLGVVGVAAVSGRSDTLVSAYELSANQWGRLGFGSGPLAEGDELSNSLRREVAERSWTTFLDRPVTGTGTGMTGDTTHNMYLMLAAEHGIVGLLLFPFLAVALLYRPEARKSVETWAFALFLVLWGLFSHNVLEEFPLLFCIAIASRPVGIAIKGTLREPPSHVAEAQ